MTLRFLNVLTQSTVCVTNYERIVWMAFSEIAL